MNATTQILETLTVSNPAAAARDFATMLASRFVGSKIVRKGTRRIVVADDNRAIVFVKGGN
jgi:hypothetical protein